MYSLKEAKGKVKKQERIIYLGWLMAGVVKGYKKAAKRYKISAVCGVGMGVAGSQQQDIIKTNNLPSDLPVFELQGGFDISKLHGIYKFMMLTMKKTVGKGLRDKTDRTPDEEIMLDMLENGRNFVSADKLECVVRWLEKAE